MTKRLTLNAEKRKAIENVFQSHWFEHSKFNQGLQEAKEKYNQMRGKMLQLCSNIVRPGISSSCACVWISFNLLYTTTRSCPETVIIMPRISGGKLMTY